MNTFTVKQNRGAPRIAVMDRTFISTDGWEGLWVPVGLLRRPVEADGHHPGHKQEHGTCQLRGESAVRKAAREYVRDHEQWLEITAEPEPQLDESGQWVNG